MGREDKATWKANYFTKIVVSIVWKLTHDIRKCCLPIRYDVNFLVVNRVGSPFDLCLQQLLDDYPKCFIVGADNVGSKQMQQIRMSLRGTAVVLMGKNTMMRKAIRGHLERNPALEK